MLLAPCSLISTQPNGTRSCCNFFEFLPPCFPTLGRPVKIIQRSLLHWDWVASQSRESRGISRHLFSDKGALLLASPKTPTVPDVSCCRTLGRDLSNPPIVW